MLAPPATEGRTVPLLVPGTGSLITVDTGTGRYSSARLAVPRHRYRAPQMLGPKVYIPDETAGALLVYDAAANRFEEPVRVTGRPATLDVFVRDGMLWAHDPSGPRAVVVDERGGRKSVDKYKDRVAGGPNRRAIPSPAGRRPAAGRRPSAADARPAASRAAAGAAGQRGRHAGGGDDAHRLPALPGRGDHRVRAQGRPVRPGGEPGCDPQGAGPLTFTVRGGDCGREYRFRVAVRYRDSRGRTRERVSAASDPVRPCVTPGAPTGLGARATASGARVSWTAPAGASAYRLGWDGPVSGSRTVSATSATLGDVSTNGSYTFTVAAVNGAGTGTTASAKATLTGPTNRYPVERNGQSNAYIRSTPDANNGSTVATMNDNNGEMVTVHCQVKGAYYNRNADLAGDMYVRLTWQGKTGYLIGYLVDTPGSGRPSPGRRCGSAVSSSFSSSSSPGGCRPAPTMTRRAPRPG